MARSIRAAYLRASAPIRLFLDHGEGVQTAVALALAAVPVVVAFLSQWHWLLALEIPVLIVVILRLEYIKGRVPSEIAGNDEPSNLNPDLAKVFVELGVRTLEADYSLLHTQMERLLGFLQVDGVVLAGIVAGTVAFAGAHSLDARSTTLLLGSVAFIGLSMLMCIYGMRSAGYGAIPSPGKRNKLGVRQVSADLEQRHEAETYVAIIQALRMASLANTSLLATKRTTVVLAPVFLLLGLLAATGAGVAAGLGSASPRASVSPAASASPACRTPSRIRNSANCQSPLERNP